MATQNKAAIIGLVMAVLVRCAFQYRRVSVTALNHSRLRYGEDSVSWICQNALPVLPLDCAPRWFRKAVRFLPGCFHVWPDFLAIIRSPCDNPANKHENTTQYRYRLILRLVCAALVVESNPGR